jgi:4,5-DOPA dioxygenase extradiol
MSMPRIRPAKEVFAALADAPPTPRMPVLFVGHGNPMNAIEDNAYSRKWREVGSALTRPRVIVVISAHWMTRGHFVTAMPNPKMIYDMYGFPDELYTVQYPAPGSPRTAEEICKMVKGIQFDHEWGLDHGAWSVLVHLFPDADIPVLQLSLNYAASPKQEFELALQLRDLRDKGVLFIGSGNIVHNLRAMRMDGGVYDWALSFDELVKQKMNDGDFTSLISYEKLGAAARYSIPTDEHYRPMLSALALRSDKETPHFFNEMIDLGSVSMRSFLLYE